MFDNTECLFAQCTQRETQRPDDWQKDFEAYCGKQPIYAGAIVHTNHDGSDPRTWVLYAALDYDQMLCGLADKLIGRSDNVAQWNKRHAALASFTEPPVPDKPHTVFTDLNIDIFGTTEYLEISVYSVASLASSVRCALIGHRMAKDMEWRDR